MNALQAAQLSSILANFSRTFTGHNPAQDRMAAGLQDSAQGMIQAEAAKKAKEDAEKKKKKNKTVSTIYDIGQAALAAYTGGASLGVTGALKGTVMGVAGADEAPAAGGGSAVSPFMAYAAMSGAKGGPQQGGTQPQPKYPGLNPGENPFKPWEAIPGSGRPGTSSGGYVPNPPFPAGGKSRLDTMTQQERLKWAINRRDQGHPLSPGEFSMFPRKEWAGLEANQVQRPSSWQMFGHYANQIGQQQMAMRPQMMLNISGSPYGYYQQEPW